MKREKCSIFLGLLIFCAAIFAGTGYGEKNEVDTAKTTPESAVLTPQEILQKADKIRAPGDNFIFEMKITFKKGEEETVNRLKTRVKGFNKSLVVYEYPPSQKGRVLLMVEDNLWIYFTGTRRPMRISPQQQLLGQVSNADVARIVYSVDYEAESAVEETEGDDTLLNLSLKPKTKGAAYGKINLWVRKNSYQPVKATFFTLTGKLLKTIYYKGYKTILGAERPTIQEIHDAINTAEITVMEYSNWKIEDTPENYFQKTFMQRVSKLKM